MRGDGHVYQQKGSSRWWIRYWAHGREHRQSSGSTKRSDAVRLLRTKLRQIRSGSFVGPEEDRLTVNELLDSYVARLANRGSRSVASVTSHLKPIRAAMGDRRAIDLRTTDTEVYQQERTRQGKAPQTIDHELGALRAAYSLARKQERLSRAPFVPMFRPDNRRTGFFEPWEVEAVTSILPGALADVTRFAYLSGWRKGEILPLRWESVDRNASEIRLEVSKNGDRRTLPLVGTLLELIERRWQAREYQTASGSALSPFVFHERGKPFGDFRKAWAAACQQAGVRKLFHDLRRTAVRNLVRAGVPQSVAMSISGHRTLSMFMRYNITDERDKQKALRDAQAYVEAQTTPSKVLRLNNSPATGREPA